MKNYFNENGEIKGSYSIDLELAYGATTPYGIRQT